jgi:hypothetical protein
VKNQLSGENFSFELEGGNLNAKHNTHSIDSFTRQQSNSVRTTRSVAILRDFAFLSR